MTTSPGLPTCIIGMHRSGTSMVARLLNLAGLDLGDPTRFLDPQADNPLGFWENRDIMELNDRLLAHQGGSWMHPPSWGKNWDSAPHIPALLDEAAAIINRAYGSRTTSQWGWKDPRATLTLPFWQRVVGPFRRVLVVRNPVDVARSLETRHGWSIESAMLLWKQYMDSAFRYSVGIPMLVTFYDDYFQDPMREIRRLLRFCGLRSDIAEQRLLDTIQRGHRHHGLGRQGLLLCRECPDEVKFMYFGVQQVREDIEKGMIHLGDREWPSWNNGGESIRT